MMRTTQTCLFTIIASTSLSMAATEEISFNEKIQPILSEYCYHCHGPDSGTRAPKKSPLRLDRKADAFQPRDNGKAVIIPGNPAESELVKRIKTQDEDDIMPPPESHKVLKPEEIALLEKWISQGATYEDHWAFLPLKRPEVPAAGKDWAANPIDNFIAEKLDQAKLKPNPTEDPRKLFRRLSFDLTGLPPSQEETDAFVQAAGKNIQAAVEAAADSMLATTASAEHFTRQWLDAARYADTHGIHIDNFRNIWPYRDWVIAAFQKNMPWDQFTVEQLAGDLLPNPTIEQKIATGFQRCLPTTGEGGAIGEEYEAIYAKDRVDTTAAIWLGLTTGCASCHDHKFDPLTTKDFYSMTAFFRNNTMSALDGNNASHPPVMFAPQISDREAWQNMDSELAAVDKKINDRASSARAEFEKWLLTAKIGDAPPTFAGTVLDFPLNEASGPLKGQINNAPLSVDGGATVSRINGPTGNALRADSAVINLGTALKLSRKDQFTIMFNIFIEGAPNGAILAKMEAGPNYRGWDVFIEAGKIATHAIDKWQANANKVSTNNPLSPGKWHHVAIAFDGTSKKTQVIYVDGISVPVTATASGLKPNAKIENDLPLQIGSRNAGDSKLNGSVALQNLRIIKRILPNQEIALVANAGTLKKTLEIPAVARTAEQTEALYQYFLAIHDSVGAELRKQKEALLAKQAEIKERGSDTLIMDERPNKQPSAFILTRGEYTAKGEKVDANTPAALPGMPKDAPKNRLGLAKWLIDPANPLPARVTVNRAWSYFMGNGIVETTSDFGIMGARPTHGHLLDWLATSFISSKWDYRKLCKAIVTSATYRQSPTISPQKLEADPFNKLLSRGPRYRLEAEQLRDLALKASDLLVNKIGGPPVRPYQPEGIWEAIAMKESNTRHYKQDEGDALYRRSLYTIWKRIAPPASMEILNAPSREVSCVRRDRTNTPLQAFVILNDPQFVEAAKFLAAKAMKAGADFDARLKVITQSLISREMSAKEKSVVQATFDKALTTFKADQESATKLLATGAKPAPAELPAAELAAWTFVASQILNLDETLTK